MNMLYNLVAIFLVATQLIVSVPLNAQQPAAEALRSVIGTLNGEDGTALANGILILTSIPTQAKRRVPPPIVATSDQNGQFRFDVGSAGEYSLCAGVRNTSWLDPCSLRDGAVRFSLQPNERIKALSVTLKRGVLLKIRFIDPSGLLDRHEGKTPGAHLMVGVHGISAAFRPASLVDASPAARDYQVLVPLSVPMTLVISSGFYHIADNLGIQLPRNRGLSIPITIPASGKAPDPINFAIAGAAQ